MIFKLLMLLGLIATVAVADTTTSTRRTVDAPSGAEIQFRDGTDVNGSISGAGAWTLGPVGNTNEHTMRGPVTFQDNSAGTASADIRLRGGGTGFTHSALRLESTGQGRGGGVYYLNTFGQRNWFFGIPYMASGDSDSFVVNRRSSPTFSHQADTSDPLNANVTNLMRLTATQANLRATDTNTLAVTRITPNAANAIGVAFFNNATNSATHYSALYGYAGSGRDRAFAFDAVGAGGVIGEALPGGTWTFGPTGFTGTHSIRGAVTMTRSANSHTRLQVRNLDGGANAYAEVSLSNDSGVAAALFRNSSSQTAYAGASSINLGSSSTIPVGMVYNNTLRASFTTSVNLWSTATVGATQACWSGAAGAIRTIGTCSSTLRLKENVNDISDDESSKIYDLRPVSFNWKDGGAKDYGLIAEDVEQHIPELVEKNMEGEVGGVNYSHLTAFLLAEIQRLNKRIERLELLNTQ